MKRQKLNSRRTAALLASTLVLSQAEPILALADVKMETAAETVTDENTVVITSVDRFCSMLWVSPMSASTWSNTEIWLPSAAGISMPLIAMRVSRPAVFRATAM